VIFKTVDKIAFYSKAFSKQTHFLIGGMRQEKSWVILETTLSSKIGRRPCSARVSVWSSKFFQERASAKNSNNFLVTNF